MQEFGKIISNGSISRKELLEKTADSLDENAVVVKNAWNSFRLFLPLINYREVTAKEAGIKVGTAKGREKVIIPA